MFCSDSTNDLNKTKSSGVITTQHKWKKTFHFNKVIHVVIKTRSGLWTSFYTWQLAASVARLIITSAPEKLAPGLLTVKTGRCSCPLGEGDTPVYLSVRVCRNQWALNCRLLFHSATGRGHLGRPRDHIGTTWLRFKIKVYHARSYVSFSFVSFVSRHPLVHLNLLSFLIQTFFFQTHSTVCAAIGIFGRCFT